MYVLQTQINTMATSKQQTIHPTMQALQTQLKKQHSHGPVDQKTTKRISTASITNTPETNTPRQQLNKKKKSRKYKQSNQCKNILPSNHQLVHVNTVF